MIYSIMVVVQVVIALSLIGLILVQHGKGADAGAAFGSGASGTVFGAKGTANFLSRATAGLATLFFVVSLSLAYLVNGTSAPSGSVTDQIQQPSAVTGAPEQKSRPDSDTSAAIPGGDADEARPSGGNDAGTTAPSDSQRSPNGGAKPSRGDTGPQIPQ